MEWVSVKQRLPAEEKTPVLIHNSKTKVSFVAFCIGGRFAFPGHEFEGITHWMPFPEPPPTAPNKQYQDIDKSTSDI